MFNVIMNRFSLRSVLIINVIVPLLLAMAAATYFGLQALEQIVEDRLQEDVQLVARAIRLPVSYSLEKERFGSIAQTLQSVFRIGRVYGAYVYDTRGRRLAAVGAVEPEQKQDDVKAVVERGRRQGQYEKIQGRRVYSYFMPLFDTSGKSSGLLQITRRKSDIEDYIHGLRSWVLVILAGTGIFISGFVLFGFHSAAGRYFRKLTKSMARVQAGERAHRAGQRGPKEIASLAKALNGMLDSVDRSEKEIAERREAQRELENKLRQSEKMAAIGQLAAGVAHELGAPLSLVDGKAQRCLRAPDIDSSQKSSLQDIRKQVRRMNDIVRQLLDFGKGAMREKRWTRVDHIAGSAVLTVSKEVGGSVEIFKEGPVPGPFIFIDPLRFEQALTNLLRNAAETGKTTRIRLTWEPGGNGEMVFRVEDNGPGIADADKPRIFEPFFTTRNNTGNSGMGLSVVHGIVREHGGVIEIIDSELGGAGFRIDLPPQTEQQHKGQGGDNV
ncbi:MAG: HAMP domain-containing sensor histidine kinase [Thermodesulfobacteriota bacterium]